MIVTFLFMSMQKRKQFSSGETLTVTKAKQHQVIFGGDQLTAVRMRNAQQARLNKDFHLMHFLELSPWPKIGISKPTFFLG